jgi:hypothetical protein
METIICVNGCGPDVGLCSVDGYPPVWLCGECLFELDCTDAVVISVEAE